MLHCHESFPSGPARTNGSDPIMPYAILTCDHDCDGRHFALYSPATFAAQSYFEESEGEPITKAEFDANYWPSMDSHARTYWQANGFASV